MKPLAIIGIGAATGGLSALEQMLDNLPDGSGLAVVALLVLPRESDVQVAALLQHHTGMAVRPIRNGVLFQADSIYVTTVQAQVTVRDGRFAADPDADAHYPIDALFASLAEEAGPRAVGVILSGEGDDGTRGIRAIRAAGGTVVVQHPLSAHADGMPRHAIATGVCDDILYPHQIPLFLLKLRAGRQAGAGRVFSAV